MTTRPKLELPEMLRETLADQASREQFGANVRLARQVRGLTLKDVEANSDLSPQAISRVELGQRAPNTKTLVGIAKALGVEFSVDHMGVRIVDVSAGLIDDDEEPTA